MCGDGVNPKPFVDKVVNRRGSVPEANRYLRAKIH